MIGSNHYNHNHHQDNQSDDPDIRTEFNKKYGKLIFVNNTLPGLLFNHLQRLLTEFFPYGNYQLFSMHLDNIRTISRLENQRHVFHDRVHAGEILAGMLAEYRDSDALVLAIPAGGVPVAAVIAGQLGLQLDVLPVSKILYPWTTESGFGAIAYDGTQWINDAAVQHYNLDADAVRQATRVAQDKVERRIRNLRGNRPFPELTGRTVILVDDGIAAGSTVRAAILTLRKQHTGMIIIATPTAHDTSLDEIATLVDLVYCANLRQGWSFAVAEAYRNWSDVSEKEVMEILHVNNT